MSSTTAKVLAVQITTAVHLPCPDPRDLLLNHSNYLRELMKLPQTAVMIMMMIFNLAMNICAISMLIYAIIADQFVIFIFVA